MHFNIPWRRNLAYTSRFTTILLIIVLASCDALPEETDTFSRPPTLSNLSYTPRELDLGTADPNIIVGGNANVAFSVSVDAEDPDGSVEQVNFILRSPTIGSEPLANVEMTASGSGQYTVSHTQQLPEGETGDYTIELYAVDNTGTLSNRVLGTFTLLNVQDPPVIESVEAPTTVQRPAEGTTSFQLIATVSDPQGIANISTVLAWNVIAPQATFALFDDGVGGEDEVAGDGRYTATVQISSTNGAGVNTLAFQATDRAGLRSEVVTVDITIE